MSYVSVVTQTKTLKQAYFDLGLKLPLDDRKVKERLDRAYGILAEPGYEVSQNTNGSYTIHKLSTSLLEDNSQTYTVDTSMCTCYDYPTARAGLCKHRLAVMMVESMANNTSYEGE